MKFQISKVEIIRRKKAYITFSICIILGIFLGSIVFNQNVSIYAYIFLMLSLFLLGFFSFDFFRKILPIKIILSDQSIERIRNNMVENYLLAEINKIKIKWTTRNTIREIYIFLKNKQNFTITALDNFKMFRENLLKKVSKKSIIKEKHELVNFDHPSFYIILGLLIGNISIFSFKLLKNISYEKIRLGINFLVIYLVIFGLYFFVKKPISRASGKKTEFSDYFVAGLMIFLGIIIQVYLI